MSKIIKLMLVDDQTLFRQATTHFLVEYGNFKVIAEAENGIEVLEKLKDQEPDVILMDIEMPLMCGDEATIEIKKNYPGIGIIILTMFSEAYYAMELLKAGADGYLAKNCNMGTLLEAIEVVYNGGIYVEKEVSTLLELSDSIRKPENCVLGRKALNSTELLLLRLLSNGKSGKQISDELKICLDTFNYHKRNIKTKTKCISNSELVLYSVRNGIVPLYPIKKIHQR